MRQDTENLLGSTIQKWKLPTPLTFAEIMARKFPPIQWLAKDLIPASAITVVSGDGGSFKSYLMLHLATCLVAQGQFLKHFDTISSGVLFVDEENGYPLFQQRLSNRVKGNDVPIHVVYGSDITINEESTSQLISYCQKHNIKTIVFDALVAMLGNADENIASDMRKIFKHFRTMRDEGISVIVIQHNRKQSQGNYDAGQNMRGSSDIRNAGDCHIGIVLKGNEITIDQTKIRGSKRLPKFIVRVEDNDNSGLSFEYVGLATNIKQAKSLGVPRVIIEILAETTTELNKSRLIALVMEQTKMGKSTVLSILTNMIRSGRVLVSKGSTKNSLICSLSQNEKPLEADEKSDDHILQD